MINYEQFKKYNISSAVRQLHRHPVDLFGHKMAAWIDIFTKIGFWPKEDILKSKQRFNLLFKI